MRKTPTSYLFDTKNHHHRASMQYGWCFSVDAAGNMWKSDRRGAADLFRAGIVVLQASVSARQ
jgi:hypothetical protein